VAPVDPVAPVGAVPPEVLDVLAVMNDRAALVATVPTESVTVTTNECCPSAHWEVSATKRMWSPRVLVQHPGPAEVALA
jgi:hypothetical protein